ncbi:endolytic transglycosylase MltG [Ornithinibacillus sp. L9]|uniref:Endolytic murein transglycosylase n=1 Tax=Ornithinibacillus caprae TaxID=2678566 RepID=A0A6N8FBI6_9BACI|nr:endolytic transglycosylase MltG [Ornithinibacillus caprae]MUK87022.1 endolytic transglycosylase MltG [Ornithinibacillus caprae]
MSDKKKTGKYRDNLIARGEEARTVRKIVAIIIISLLLILVVGGISGYNYIKSGLQPVDPDNEQGVEVEIPLGSSSSTIASVLEENGIIKDSRIFRFYIKFKNESGFQAGEYTFTKSMTFDEIIESLKSGRIIKDPVYRITIPEGYTVEQIAEVYADTLPITKDEFLDKVNDMDYIEELMEEYPSILSEEILHEDIKTPLEGYLFAATYDIYEADPPVEVLITNMLDKTREVVYEYIDGINETEFSIHEAITMASLVEKEAVTEEQRKTIAGIFYNRMDEGMRLQTDPTVLYAIGTHKGKVLLSDLEIKSPYNTYVIDALPIGPISNFSQSALESTLYPEETDYLYFLHDDEGNIHYAETNDEHNENRRKYIQ